MRGWKNIFPANGKQNEAGVAMLISDKINKTKIEKITRDKEGHYIMIRGSIQEKDITIINTYVKKAECQRIDAFELWCWRRLLRVPWTARRSNQSILKETSPGCSLEGLMLSLKLQYFGHLMQRVDSLEKTLMLGGIGGRRRRG